MLIVGAGPAGAIAGLVLARAGARVRIVDRSTFPRDKLCGDTVNPGTLAAVRRLGVAAGIDATGLQVDGMWLTGEGRASVVGRYPDGLHGRAILRRDLDWELLQHAMASGCRFDPGIRVLGPAYRDVRGVRVVGGVVVGTANGSRSMSAPVTIAADGRRSTMAFAVGAARHPKRPRRWAIGGYFTDVAPTAELGQIGVRHVSDTCLTRVRHVSDPGSPGFGGTLTLGEMHVRRDRYVGVAPVPGGLTNVCLVRASHAGDPELRDPTATLTRTLAADPRLRDRFAAARLAAPPVVLGPLAIDVDPIAVDGLLLAGDAAGFVDPMTGDGLRFAVRGGELAAGAALQALANGWSGVQANLADVRRREFASKLRFNRALRSLVASPDAVAIAAWSSRLAPGVFRRVVAHAGDCAVAR